MKHACLDVVSYKNTSYSPQPYKIASDFKKIVTLQQMYT